MKTQEQRRKEREEYDALEAHRIEVMKANLAAEHKIPRDRKFDIAWRIAWEHGHSSGFDEVRYYFNDLVELIKP